MRALPHHPMLSAVLPALLALVAVAGCGKSVDEAASEAAIRAATGQDAKVERDGDTTIISTGDGAMTLDLSLVLARPAAFEYVLVHELCHLIRADHSRAFWREVELRCPQWRDEREYFKAEGRQLKATLRALCGKTVD